MRSAGSGKSRKPYKITKPRERWSEDEHEKFLEAIDRFGRNWKEIVSFVGTRSVSQVRSHAQKHFIRLEKKGLGAVVPPARRKARWSDKQTSEGQDGSADSDQELSASHRQAGSSSSMSTVDYHPPVTSAAHCAEGSGCHEFADCQPLSCPQQRFGSFSSRSTSFTSPPTQSIISCAQELLQCCNSSGGNSPVKQEQHLSAPVQGIPVQPRAAVMDMLQQIASQPASGSRLQGLPQGLPGNAQSSAAVALQQQQLQKLLNPQQSSTYSPLPSRQSSNATAAVGAWPWQRAAAATNFPSRFSASRREQNSVLDQQPCSQLDGTFLAEVIKTSDTVPSAIGFCQSLNPAQPFLPPVSPSPVDAAFASGLNAAMAPATPLASPNTSFQSIPSAVSTLSVQPVAQLPESLCTPGADLDSPVGLDEEEFWADLDLVDPLMQAADAFMEADAPDDSCLQSVYTNISTHQLC